MNSEQLVELIKEIVELEDISLETELDEELWDSLAVVTFISLVNERFDIVVPAEKVITASAVKDLL